MSVRLQSFLLQSRRAKAEPRIEVIHIGWLVSLTLINYVPFSLVSNNQHNQVSLLDCRFKKSLFINNSYIVLTEEFRTLKQNLRSFLKIFTTSLYPEAIGSEFEVSRDLVKQTIDIN